LSLDFDLSTDCQFGMRSVKRVYFLEDEGLYYDDRVDYQLEESVEDISECNLVMCNSGNLILKGFNTAISQWKIVWQFNERVTGDC
jgi:hypothetical protein